MSAVVLGLGGFGVAAAAQAGVLGPAGASGEDVASASALLQSAQEQFDEESSWAFEIAIRYSMSGGDGELAGGWDMGGHSDDGDSWAYLRPIGVEKELLGILAEFPGSTGGNPAEGIDVITADGSQYVRFADGPWEVASDPDITDQADFTAVADMLSLCTPLAVTTSNDGTTIDCQLEIDEQALSEVGVGSPGGAGGTAGVPDMDGSMFADIDSEGRLREMRLAVSASEGDLEGNWSIQLRADSWGESFSIEKPDLG